ncbi:DNA-binding transcriptional regulator, LysR family [Micrococcales bacterium KH10]|nr:DNA-binding transcriptional regulator, LysR family [Micrococcales bacterium KH10]
MLSLARLRVLRELRRHGTLAEVAKNLNYTPSAVSQQLAALEAEAGATLTIKVGRRLRLTAQGEVLADHADVLLERMEQAEAELAAMSGQVAGRLRVSSFQSVLLALIPQTLSILSEQYPGLRVDVTQYDEADAADGLFTYDYDLVLGEEYPGEPVHVHAGVDWRELVLEPMRLALPPEGPWSDPRLRLADLADAPWVLERPNLIFGRWAQNVILEAGFEPDVRFFSSDMLLHLHLVEQGHAVALIPDLLSVTEPARVTLVPLEGDQYRRLLTGVRAGSGNHPAIRAFRAALEQTYRDVTAR